MGWGRAGGGFVAVSCIVALAAGGCGDPRDQIGRTWYIDGVGNWGFGVTEVPAGLYARGYQGRVDNFRWSLTLNPVLDQTFRVFARAGGSRLAGAISAQQREYPDAPVNLIGLSAGTGVAIWAVEDLKPPAKVNNVVLLASSLSSRYDLRKALSHMRGKIVVYYSPHDTVLDGPARLLGSIDGRFDDCAGLVGMHGPGSDGGRVVNIAWNSRYESLGWTGSHTDCTSQAFIEAEVASYIDPRADRTNAQRERLVRAEDGDSARRPPDPRM